jgi:hypothetical protein
MIVPSQAGFLAVIKNSRGRCPRFHGDR